jgi:serine/threonine protein kinase
LKLTSFGRYRIETELGTGRFSETYQAYDLVRRRTVALKLLRSDLLPDERAWTGFLAEIQRAAELVHPHIAWIWEAGEIEGRYFLAERFVGGESLSAHLSQYGPLPADQALKYLEHIAQAIDFSEQRGWTHGSVTPRNILLSRDLGAVLSDYGLLNAARLKLPGLPVLLEEAPYLPPEVLRGGPRSPRVDLYALACSLVEALTGHSPYHGDRLEEILDQKGTALEVPLPSLETIPLQASRVIVRALDPEPGARFNNVLDFVDALDRAVRLGLTDAAALAQHEEQLRRWREVKEQDRTQAEEASRLEAVQQARLEIQERARREAEQVIELQDAPLEQGDSPVQPHQAVSRRRASAEAARRRTLLLGLVLLVVIGLGGFWLFDGRFGSGSFLPSATPDYLATGLALPSITATATPIPTSTPLPTQTASPSPTLTRSPTPSSSPTSTASQTATPTNPPASSTPERPDRD